MHGTGAHRGVAGRALQIRLVRGLLCLLMDERSAGSKKMRGRGVVGAEAKKKGKPERKKIAAATG